LKTRQLTGLEKRRLRFRRFTTAQPPASTEVFGLLSSLRGLEKRRFRFRRFTTAQSPASPEVREGLLSSVRGRPS
jgi:hypothetical protein